MITKEMWSLLSSQKKIDEISKALQEVYDIENGKHELHGKPEQGRLAKIKKDLEHFILQTLDWEQGTKKA